MKYLTNSNTWLGLWFALAVGVGVWCIVGTAADVTPGYTFSSGEANVTATKLNTAAAGTINTTFFSLKSSAGADPTPTTHRLLLHDTANNVFKRALLSVAVFNHSSFLAGRTAKTTPVGADALLLEDSEDFSALKRMVWTNLLYGGSKLSSPTNEDSIAIFDASAGTHSHTTMSNLVGGLTAHATPSSGDSFLILTETNSEIQRVTLGTMVSGVPVFTGDISTNSFPIWDGESKQVRGSNIVAGLASSVTSPAGTETIVVLDGSTLKKLLLSDLHTYTQRTNNVQMTEITDARAITMVPATWTNVTSFSVTITPATPTNAVLLNLSLRAVAGSDPAMYRVTRDGTAIGVGDDDGGDRVECAGVIGEKFYDDDIFTEHWTYLDNPGTGAAVTYQVQIFKASGTVYLNRSTADTDANDHGRAQSSLIAQEIFQ